MTQPSQRPHGNSACRVLSDLAVGTPTEVHWLDAFADSALEFNAAYLEEKQPESLRKQIGYYLGMSCDYAYFCSDITLHWSLDDDSEPNECKPYAGLLAVPLGMLQLVRPLT